VSGFYKMDPAAWDFGTADLSLEEEAAYLRIVNAIHKHDGPVPNNDRVLAGLFRSSTRKARALLDALVSAGKVVIEDGKIWNERARSDLVQRQLTSGSAALRGSKGGRKRAEMAAKSLEDNDAPQANASSRIEENRIEETPIPPRGPSFDDFWQRWPNKAAKSQAEKAWNKVKPADREIVVARCVDWFTAWRKAHPEATAIYAATFLNQRRWQDMDETASTQNPNAVAEFWAKHLNDPAARVPQTAISPSLARLMLELRLVTPETLKRRGFAA
jgi:uncharacterized protein YdaU (DUF1376 family)